jgi:hypothetical protein
MSACRSCCAVALLSVYAVVALAAMMHVPADLPTIQSALDSIADQDTVLVADGLYPEALLAPPLKFWLLGDVPVDTGDFVRPIIDASFLPDSVGRGCFTLVAGSYAQVERFRFRNHSGALPPPSTAFGVVLHGDSASFQDCAFDSVISSLHHGQHEPQVYVKLDRCVFRYYVSDVILPATQVWATDCYFTDKENGDVQLVCGAHSLVENCRFDHTRWSFLATGGPDITVRNCIFGPSVPQLQQSITLGHYSVRFVNNLLTDLQGLTHMLRVDPDSLGGTVIDSNTFVNCHRIATSNTTLIYICTFDGQPVTAAYEVAYNTMVQCSTGSVARAISARGPGTFIGNRIHDLANPAWPAIVFTGDDSARFTNNVIYNTGFAMRCDDAQLPVDAKFNWWGDSTGPYHPTLNPDGLGDQVGNNITFIPWSPDTSFLSVSDFRRPLPEQFVLEAYPNPFNSTVTLKLIPPDAMIVRVELFDILGRRIKELWSGPLAFEKQVSFDGSELASGIDFVRVWQPIGNRQLALKKLVLLK